MPSRFQPACIPVSGRTLVQMLLRASHRPNPETLDIHRRVGSILFQTAHHRFGELATQYSPFDQIPPRLAQHPGSNAEPPMPPAVPDSPDRSPQVKRKKYLEILSGFAPAALKNTYSSLRQRWAAEKQAKQVQHQCEEQFLSTVLRQLHTAGFELVSQQHLDRAKSTQTSTGFAVSVDWSYMDKARAGQHPARKGARGSLDCRTLPLAGATSSCHRHGTLAACLCSRRRHLSSDSSRAAVLQELWRRFDAYSVDGLYAGVQRPRKFGEHVLVAVRGQGYRERAGWFLGDKLDEAVRRLTVRLCERAAPGVWPADPQQQQPQQQPRQPQPQSQQTPPAALSSSKPTAAVEEMSRHAAGESGEDVKQAHLQRWATGAQGQVLPQGASECGEILTTIRDMPLTLAQVLSTNTLREPCHESVIVIYRRTVVDDDGGLLNPENSACRRSAV